MKKKINSSEPKEHLRMNIGYIVENVYSVIMNMENLQEQFKTLGMSWGLMGGRKESVKLPL